MGDSLQTKNKKQDLAVGAFFAGITANLRDRITTIATTAILTFIGTVLVSIRLTGETYSNLPGRVSALEGQLEIRVQEYAELIKTQAGINTSQNELNLKQTTFNEQVGVTLLEIKADVKDINTFLRARD